MSDELVLRVDCGAHASRDALIPAEGEYVRAVALWPAALQPRERVELYAYEIVERVRELCGEGGERSVPLWPEPLFGALEGVVPASWRVLGGMLPAGLRVRVAEEEQDYVRAFARFLPGLPLDPAAYARELATWASVV